jgi:hypothetical protein
MRQCSGNLVLKMFPQAVVQTWMSCKVFSSAPASILSDHNQQEHLRIHLLCPQLLHPTLHMHSNPHSLKQCSEINIITSILQLRCSERIVTLLKMAEGFKPRSNIKALSRFLVWGKQLPDH